MYLRIVSSTKRPATTAGTLSVGRTRKVLETWGKANVRWRSLPVRAGGADRGENASEELIARLKAAEEEAKELKLKLDAVNASNVEETTQTTPKKKETKRIDGADLRRETLSFVENKPRNWLSESDIEFFTGGGPSELEDSGAAGSAGESPAAVVQRRLVLGIGLSVALGAFSLVPTEQLQLAPSKPLFFYLVPLLRVRALLDEVLAVATEGDYDRMSRLLARIEGPPNNVQQNLKSASAALAATDGRLAQRADTVGRDVYEYLKGVDYQTYFESRIGSGGDQTKEFFEYSTSSAKAAAVKLDEFLGLMPDDQLEAAKVANASGGGY
mmetsp:Transcript_10142/g.27647  ORF Transcript_10142/g.27647 Transcript_10142/m.27647 type:complete len:327 (-) Transcript_10142:1826-2806(-)